MNYEFVTMPLGYSEVPANWFLQVTEMASSYVADRFHWLSRGLKEPGPMANVKLDTDLVIACDQLLDCLHKAYLNPGGSGTFSIAREALTLVVHVEMDIVRYAEALAQGESGISNEREESLLRRFPPGNGGTVYLERPAIVVGTEGTILLWYLPGALTPTMQVGIVIREHGILQVICDLRQRCGMPQCR